VFGFLTCGWLLRVFVVSTVLEWLELEEIDINRKQKYCR